MNLSMDVKLIKVGTAAGAGTTDVVSDVVDTQGFNGVAFFGSLAAVNSANYAQAAQGLQSNMSDAAPLSGSKATPAANGDSFLLDISRPIKRYVQLTIKRGVSTAIGDVYAVLYSPMHSPTVHGSTISAVSKLTSPDEGTP